MTSNLYYCDVATRDAINRILRSDSIHQIVKDTIRAGLSADCLDAMHDSEIAATALRRVSQSIQHGAVAAAAV